MEKLKKILIIMGLTLCWVSAVVIFYLNYSADIAFKKSDLLLQAGEVGRSLDKINYAIKANPNEPLYYRERAKIYLVAVIKSDPESVVYLKVLALKDLQKAYSLNPKNLATLRNEVPLYYFLSVKNMEITSGADNIDAKFLPYARSFYKTVEGVSPNDVGIFVLLAKYENRLGLQSELTYSVDRIKQLRPDLFQWNESLRDLNISL